jgi:hypothetical protein
MPFKIGPTCETCGAVCRKRKARLCRSCYRAAPRTTRERRFWAKVTTGDGCWEWAGYTDSYGYGQLQTGLKEPAHRVSWEINVGPIPEGLQVLHHCDNPPCVRPDHLFLGTQSDNIKDMWAKGRGQSGAILTVADVRAIRQGAALGQQMPEMAQTYGVSTTAIRDVVTGRRWGSVVGA